MEGFKTAFFICPRSYLRIYLLIILFLSENFFLKYLQDFDLFNYENF